MCGQGRHPTSQEVNGSGCSWRLSKMEAPTFNRP